MFLKDMKKNAALILVFEYDNSEKEENMKKSKIKFKNFYNKLNNDEDDLPVDFYIKVQRHVRQKENFLKR